VQDHTMEDNLQGKCCDWDEVPAGWVNEEDQDPE